MSLERKHGSKWWYGRFFHGGKRQLVNLKVAVKGCPPQNGETFGDPLYERSKAEAQVSLNKLVEDVKKRGNELQLLEKAHELKTGRKFEVIPLSNMVAEYETVERKKPLDELWSKQLVSIADDFTAFCRSCSPSVTDMYCSTSKPQVAISTDGDLLIIQGPAEPALFVPQQFVQAFLTHPASTPAVLIVDVGLAAIRCVLAANADFNADTRLSETGKIMSATLRFKLPNSLIVGFTTDQALASNSSQIHGMGIDLMVTNEAIDWQREHTCFIGQVISMVQTVPPQIVGAFPSLHKELKALIKAALQKSDSATPSHISNE